MIAEAVVQVVLQIVLGFVVRPLLWLFLGLFKAVRWLMLLPVRAVRWLAVNRPTGERKPPPVISRSRRS